MKPNETITVSAELATRIYNQCHGDSAMIESALNTIVALTRRALSHIAAQQGKDVGKARKRGSERFSSLYGEAEYAAKLDEIERGKALLQGLFAKATRNNHGH